ncbi:MAG: RdgB/HAM1 family non-canonical purine NTP pyrophosphatase [Candidatus Bilamarchaeaceae archaeon]
MKEIYFATSNEHKYNEAKGILAPLGIELKWLKFSHREIRSDSLEEIAVESAVSAFKECGKPLIVEDSGVFVPALNGFPGTYTAWAHAKIGLEGLLKLMEGKKGPERAVSYVAAVAYTDGKGVITFTGELKGTLAEKIRGTKGFGHDPIFIPEGSEKTLGEDVSRKNEVSHRARALKGLAKWYVSKSR